MHQWNSNRPTITRHDLQWLSNFPGSPPYQTAIATNTTHLPPHQQTPQHTETKMPPNDSRNTQHWVWSVSHPTLAKLSSPSNEHQPTDWTQLSHLRIENQVIHWQVQHSLHDASTKTEYYQYLKEKCNWDNEHIQDIHWPPINRVRQWLTKPECRIISKFIHQWLLLETRYHVQSTSALQHCPSCKQQAETTNHFLQCPNHNDNNYGRNSSAKSNGYPTNTY